MQIFEVGCYNLNKGKMASSNKYCEPESPIIDLLKALASSDVKQMTTLTNSKLMEILEKEFYIDTTVLHAFEADVYVSVLKKYLKTWPGWEHFDENIIKIKNADDKEGISKIFKKEYVELKEYLNNLLNLTQELASDKVVELKDKENLEKEQIVMEVEATREQLNNLFYRYPIEDNIFNTSYESPGLNKKKFKLKSILNWCGVEILIQLKFNNKYLIYERRNPHRLKHTLVNKKLALNTHKNIELDENILVKLAENTIKIPKLDILKCFEDQNYSDKFKLVFSSVIEYDLKKIPNTLQVPCTFRRYSSKYRFIRYLYCNSGENMEKYDIQLEEIISPMCEFKINITDIPEPLILENSIQITCTECHMTFGGNYLEIEILKHFNKIHYEEPDWTCMKCNKIFSVRSLTLYDWCHKCN